MTGMCVPHVWLRGLIPLLVASCLLAMSLDFDVAAQEGRGARLGGSIAEFEEIYGPPDFTDQGLIRYNLVDLDGIATILVVHHNEDQIVTEIALVYVAEPAEFADPEAIARAVALQAPSDGICDGSACHSRSLMTLFTGEQLADLGFSGPLGSYNFAVNPGNDAYFEIVLTLGVEAPALRATPVAEAPSYPAVADVRDLMTGDLFSLGDDLSVSGSIMTLQIAEPGTEFRLGENDDLAVGALFQVTVAAPDGATEVLFVGFDGDPGALAEDLEVIVKGTLAGTQCFDNAQGDEVCQPLIAAVEVTPAE